MPFIRELGMPTYISRYIINFPFSNIPFLEAFRDIVMISGLNYYPVRLIFSIVRHTQIQENTRPRIADVNLKQAGDLTTLTAQTLLKHIPHTPIGVENAAKILSSKLINILTILKHTKRMKGKAAL